eukprot:CAMPEP_0205833614 /NCGR_PEP_ID=MMETSP0206-20130828/50117_1 /ASSEMBLY_ACC=CAM_ASM_000279 /TAXON_ID=36767 /ORGANISM="Euplotes focardii, Strain TN1" /LENGTH=117 /DNA_ID=CAMNT_0053140161 /DNA_START=430 /DNA_END=783 /DNA_ORIENTATION=-
MIVKSQEIEPSSSRSPDILLYLIGNQADLEDDRQVSRDRAIEFQKKNKIDAFFETSAKTGNNVEEVFALAAKQLYSLHKRDSKNIVGIPATLDSNEFKKLEVDKHNDKSGKKKKGCC